MRINQNTVDLVKHFEGLRLHAYKDSAAVVTIGYGYSERAGFGPGVKMGDVWTEEQAEEMLIAGLNHFAENLRPLFTRHPTENQFGAMLSLAYNIGIGAFSKSTCLRRFNAGDIDGAADALTWFNKAGGKVLRGLVRRREAERKLFLSDMPSDVLDAGSNEQPDGEKTPATSTTLWGTIVAGASSVGTMLTAFGELDPMTQMVMVVFGGVTLLMLVWIARERVKKLANGT